MQCPYCRVPLREAAAECPACRLTLARAHALLAPVPRLAVGVSDSTRLLGRRGQTKVREALLRLRRRFPQLEPHVVMREFSTAYPFELQVFWVFNTAGLFAESRKGGDNHGLLLAIDPPHRRAALMPGYGLEPFLARVMLDRLLESAFPAWQAGRHAAGIVTVLDGAGRLLAEVAARLPEALGLPAPAPATAAY